MPLDSQHDPLGAVLEQAMSQPGPPPADWMGVPRSHWDTRYGLTCRSAEELARDAELSFLRAKVSLLERGVALCTCVGIDRGEQHIRLRIPSCPVHRYLARIGGEE